MRPRSPGCRREASATTMQGCSSRRDRVSCHAAWRRRVAGRSFCGCSREGMEAVRWVITGAGGMLGMDLVSVLREAGHEVEPLTRMQLDVRDLSACRRAITGADVVVNTAAWTEV